MVACAMLRAMDVRLSYRGRQIADTDIAFIRQLIAADPTASRRAISRKLCQAWNWVQPNGALRDMVCRGLLLALHRGGHLELPAPRYRLSTPWVRHGGGAPAEIDRFPLQGSLRELGALEFRQVRRTSDEPLFNSLIAQHHYLGYTQPVGEHLKYLAYSQERPIACLAWSSAPRHLGCRDRFIGWSIEARRRNIRFIAYNLRFLILPWIQVPHLASHILGRMVRVLPEDWERMYGHPVYFLETFVDPQRFRGTCYRAANWVVLGRTTGRGKDDQTWRPNRSIKEVLGYPLCRRFRSLLTQVT
jgi:Druantia protein DruA